MPDHATDAPHVRVDVDGPVATITLDRPAQRNAMSAQLMHSTEVRGGRRGRGAGPHHRREALAARGHHDPAGARHQPVDGGDGPHLGRRRPPRPRDGRPGERQPVQRGSQRPAARSWACARSQRPLTALVSRSCITAEFVRNFGAESPRIWKGRMTPPEVDIMTGNNAGSKGRKRRIDALAEGSGRAHPSDLLIPFIGAAIVR